MGVYTRSAHYRFRQQPTEIHSNENHGSPILSASGVS